MGGKEYEEYMGKSGIIYGTLATILALPTIAGGVVAAVPKWRNEALNKGAEYAQVYKDVVKDNEDLQAENETLASDKTALQAQVTTLTSEKTGLQTQLTAKGTQIETLNARIAELVAQAEENNEEFQFGTYVSSMLYEDDARFADGYYDDTFAEINNDGTGRIFFYDENGEMGFEPFTYRQENDKIYVDMIDEETQEVACTYELTLSNGYFDMIVEEGEEPMRFVYCNQELHDAILTRHNLRWQVVRLSNQITTLTDRIAELEAQLGENQAQYSVTRRQMLNMSLGDLGFGANIQSSNDNTITTEEQGFSGHLGDTPLGMFGTWNSADYALTQNNIGIDDIDCYSFDIDGNIITTESTANHVDYGTDNNVEIETHLYVNGQEVMTAEDMNDIEFMYAESNLSIQFTLNENQMITELTVNCYVTGEVTPISEEQEGPVQETYSLQTNVDYTNGTDTFVFNDDNTFEYTYYVVGPGDTTKTGTYSSDGANMITLAWDDDSPSQQFVLSDNDSFDFYGSTFTVVIPEPGGNN